MCFCLGVVASCKDQITQYSIVCHVLCSSPIIKQNNWQYTDDKSFGLAVALKMFMLRNGKHLEDPTLAL